MEEPSVCRIQDFFQIISLYKGFQIHTVSRYISGINDAERLIIFMDPPYNKNLEFKVLELINASGIIKDDTVIIVEEALDADMSEAERCGFEIYRVKEYKNQKHVFLRKA